MVRGDQAEDGSRSLSFNSCASDFSSETQVTHTRFLFLSRGFWQKEPPAGPPRGCSEPTPLHSDICAPVSLRSMGHCLPGPSCDSRGRWLPGLQRVTAGGVWRAGSALLSCSGARSPLGREMERVACTSGQAFGAGRSDSGAAPSCHACCPLFPGDFLRDDDWGAAWENQTSSWASTPSHTESVHMACPLWWPVATDYLKVNHVS